MQCATDKHIQQPRKLVLQLSLNTRVIPKVSGLDILDNNIFYNLYISKMYILYEL